MFDAYNVSAKGMYFISGFDAIGMFTSTRSKHQNILNQKYHAL